MLILHTSRRKQVKSLSLAERKRREGEEGMGVSLTPSPERASFCGRDHVARHPWTFLAPYKKDGGPFRLQFVHLSPRRIPGT